MSHHKDEYKAGVRILMGKKRLIFGPVTLSSQKVRRECHLEADNVITEVAELSKPLQDLPEFGLIT